MATPSKSKPATSTAGLVDLFKEEQELQARLEQIKQRKADLAREQAEGIRTDVLKRLTEVSQLIGPLVEQEAWSWRSMPEFEGILNELELMPKEAKPVEVSAELKELVVGFLKTKPHGATIDDIANGLKDAAGEPRYKVGSLRPKLPVLVKDGSVKSKPNPQNLRQNLYLVE